MQGPRSPLQTRILFHCAHKMADEAKLMQYHQQLTENLEDQLSLASIHFQRGHYQVREEGGEGSKKAEGGGRRRGGGWRSEKFCILSRIISLLSLAHVHT
jgi:hypothetical protein